MIELRAFCADFFDKRIRSSSTNPASKEEINSFIALLRHSRGYFARARAVIPELQFPNLSYSNPNMRVKTILFHTHEMRDPQGQNWADLPEERAWLDFAKEQRKNLAINAAKDGTGHEKQLSDASSIGSNSKHVSILYRKVQQKLMCSVNKPLSTPKELDLSVMPKKFVPGNAMASEELVCSPTSGTRPRLPDEMYQQGTGAQPAIPSQSGQETLPNAISASSFESQDPLHGSRGYPGPAARDYRHSDLIRRHPPQPFRSTLSQLNQSAVRPSPLNENFDPGNGQPNNSGEMSVPGNIDEMMEMMEMTSLSGGTHSSDSSSSHYDNTAFPGQDMSQEWPPSRYQGPQYPPSRALVPYSAPPSTPSYGPLHQTGQGIYGGPSSPSHSQIGPLQHRPDPFAFVGEVRDAQSWISYLERPTYEPLPDQLPNRILQLLPQGTAQAPIPSFLTQEAAPPPQANDDPFFIPPPGSMHPLDYWDLLHQRETEIRIRVVHANRPMTIQENYFILFVGEARVNAVATYMPSRGNMSKDEWVQVLLDTRKNIWATVPRMESNPIDIARKTDFEMAVSRELLNTEREHGGFAGGTNF